MTACELTLPDKLYFKIGEVANLVGVKPYVLRYWESEFPVVRPGKTRSKHRLYRRRDVETLLEIKRLLHRERYTIQGAKQRMRTLTKPAVEKSRPVISPALGKPPYRAALLTLRQDLEALYKLLT